MGKRSRQHPGRDRWRRRASGAPADAAEVVEAAVASCAHGVAPVARHLVEALAGWPPAADAGDPVDSALAQMLVDGVADAWHRGWQPADLHRAAERIRGRAHARLAARAIAHEAARHDDAAIPPRWRLQFDAIGAPALSGGAADPWVVPWPTVDADGLGPTASVARMQAVTVAVETVAFVRSLPRLPKLGPVPGEPVRGAARAGWAASSVGADPRMLRKVTSLLAKAESTNFPDEAEALTGKAQELMTRHAIDQAHLDAVRGERPSVGGRRVGVDDPYAGARYLLLASVAEANRCRAVWTKHWGFATVFGDEGDLDGVELLFTSLLVQATRAMVAQPRPGRASAGATRSFRQSFLVAFAQRIGVRLREAADTVTADAARNSTDLVPVFARRREEADAALAEAFPETRTTRMSANDAAGWHAGTQAADRAALDLHDALDGRAGVS